MDVEAELESVDYESLAWELRQGFLAALKEVEVEGEQGSGEARAGRTVKQEPPKSI